MKTFAIAVATLLTGCLAVTAQATVPAKRVPQQIVRYGDLNLASQADSQILLGRIKSAARTFAGCTPPCCCRSKSSGAGRRAPTTPPRVPSPRSTPLRR